MKSLLWGIIFLIVACGISYSAISEVVTFEHVNLAQVEDEFKAHMRDDQERTEKQIENLEENFRFICNEVTENSVKIENIDRTLVRLIDMCDRIIVMFIGSILTTILGGGGIGFYLGHRNKK